MIASVFLKKESYILLVLYRLSQFQSSKLFSFLPFALKTQKSKEKPNMPFKKNKDFPKISSNSQMMRIPAHYLTTIKIAYTSVQRSKQEASIGSCGCWTLGKLLHKYNNFATFQVTSNPDRAISLKSILRGRLLIGYGACHRTQKQFSRIPSLQKTPLANFIYR